jgi:FAD/FMN-containing dehydrogenase
MRSQLLGIEAVMADGSIVRRLTGVHKDNTGYDLASLLAGSEGTLGVITKARLQLVPRMDRRAVALLAVAGTDSAVQIVADARRADTPLVAAEIFFEDGLQLVLSHAKAEPPFARAYPAYLLLEAASDRDPVAELSKLLTSRSDVLDVVVSEDSVGRSRLWRLRDGLSEAINGQGVPHKLDVAVPTASLGAFEQKLRELVRNLSPAARTIIWGHVGDGNLHINILGLTAADQRVDDAVLRLTIEMAGSTSGEHGVGIAKANWLAIDRSAGDMAAMRAIKQALDPRGIMNPGVLFGAIPAIRAG